MRKLFPLVVMLFVLVLLTNPISHAQTDVPTGIRNFTDAELDVLAEAAFSETLTDEQNKALDTILTIEDFWVLIYKVSRLRGMSDEEANALVEGTKREREENLQIPIQETTFMACDHQIFSAEGGNLHGSNGSWINATCDNNAADDDWVFQFPFIAGANADIRWWSNDGWIRTVFNNVYANGLTGHEMCGQTKFLCLGTNGVGAAGGNTNVQFHLKLRW